MAESSDRRSLEWISEVPQMQSSNCTCESTRRNSYTRNSTTRHSHVTAVSCRRADQSDRLTVVTEEELLQEEPWGDGTDEENDMDADERSDKECDRALRKRSASEAFS